MESVGPARCAEFNVSKIAGSKLVRLKMSECNAGLSDVIMSSILRSTRAVFFVVRSRYLTLITLNFSTPVRAVFRRRILRRRGVIKRLKKRRRVRPKELPLGEHSAQVSVADFRGSSSQIFAIYSALNGVRKLANR